MPINAGNVVIQQGDVLEDFQTPLSDYLGAKFGEAWDSNPVSMGLDYKDFKVANMAAAPRLPRPDIEKRAKEAGVKIEIPEEGLSEQATTLLINRRKTQMAREDAINRSPGGARSVAGFGVSLGASLLDPLNIGAAFVPVVGEARYASMIAKAASPLARIGVRAGVGALEGGVGIAAFEPFNYGMHQTLQDDYSAMDSIVNIGFGSLLGGGLHVVGGAFKDHVLGKWWEPDIPSPRPEEPHLTNALETPNPHLSELTPHTEAINAPEPIVREPAPNSAEAMATRVSPQTREAAMRTAVGQLMDGRTVDVEPVVMADPVAQELRNLSPQQIMHINEFGTNDPFIYHLSSSKDVQSFADNGINPSKEGMGGPGVYMANTPDATQYHTMLDEGTLFRVNKSEMIERFGKYQDGGKLEYDPSSGEILLGGDTKVPPDLIEVKINGEWKHLIPRQERANVEPSYDLQSSVERQTSVESVRVADPEASAAATERLKAAPKSENLKDAEAELERVMTDLQERFVPVEDAAQIFAELKPYDDAIKASEELSRAARAAAICDLRG